MGQFMPVFLHYLAAVIPALAAGFLISGIVHEMIPADFVSKYLGRGGFKPILISTLVGTVLPICCWGSLPIAVSFQKKGARIGSVLAFLVATPATSVSALFVAYSIFGPVFTVYIFFAVIVMGIAAGLAGNLIKYTPRESNDAADCPHCRIDPEHSALYLKKTVLDKARSALKYAYIELPKEIGLELFIGLVLAACVSAFVPIGYLVKAYLGGWFGYVFSVVFGILTYFCSTASVPFVDSLIKQRMSYGAGMTLLLIGPVTSYGTILVLRKEYGLKILSVFIATLVVSSVALGLGFQLLLR